MKIENLNECLSSIPSSPLGILIDVFLQRHPTVPNKHLYERIRDLRQGTFDDLESRADFQSFLISYLSIEQRELATIRRHLRTIVDSQRINAEPALSYAARGGATNDSLAAGSLDDILSRRVF